ncbi:MFS transporter [Bradyrhizobium prioriisuperbiae]|uniref:MFS transporter n=1 Tax=Bradyrhizobium prioriisuperbiae TaxID=2854389 RepID=UPI0028E8BD1E|nr:MFS transporter [Bradyrhizobium prioritasuperba]
MDASPNLPAVDESSIRYGGWRVVLICFLMAAFAWALGFYGQGVYLAELKRSHGWPTATISTATTFFYLFSAVLVVFVSDGIRALGLRTFLAGAVVCMTSATVLFGFVNAPWQLYVVYTLMAFGWAGLTMASISNTIGQWFDTRRALAISLALNGASVGGIVGVPLLVALIGAVGFTTAVVSIAVVMAVVLLPTILFGIGQPPHRDHHGQDSNGNQIAALTPSQIRGDTVRQLSFWTITLPFALVLLAQIGFIVHLISFMEPMIGREKAGLAMSLMTVMAVVGRVIMGFLISRLNQRVASAVLFASQALALLAMINIPGETALFAASVVFGFTVGNAITLPSMLVHQEFDGRAFGVVVSLTTAISSAISACGPAVIGVLRDLSGSYILPFYVCMGLEVAAAIGVLIRRRPRAVA